MGLRWRGQVAVASVAVLLGSLAVAVPAVVVLPSESAQALRPVTDGVAPTVERARAEAVASGKPVEVLAFRGERRDVKVNPDGSMVAREFVAPVRTVRDGAWVEVDPTLVRRADGSVAPVAATVDVAFSGGGDGPLVTLANNGQDVSWGWEGALPEPVLDGASATYPEVLPGVDLVVTALVDGFSHTLVVKSARAAANPALASIEMPVSTVGGAQVNVTEAGGVRVLDASGGVVMSADAPMMWDSAGGRSGAGLVPVGPAAPDGRTTGEAESNAADGKRAELEVTLSDGLMRLTPDSGVLTGPDTVYPVYIDPVYRDEYRSAWAMVDSGYPNEEYWKFDGNAHEGLGRCGASCNNSKVKRLFYRVSTSYYDGKDILSAQFVAVLEHNWFSSNQNHNADLYLMNSGISSSTNWNNQPSGSQVDTANTPAPSNDCSGLDDGGTEWNVTNEVQDAADDGTNSLTFGLRNDSESDHTRWMRFCHNAYLQVHYNTPPDQPDTDDMSMSPGGACSYTLTTGSYVSDLPKLRAYLFDDDHGDKNQWGPDDGDTISEQLRAQFRLVWGDDEQWTSSLSSAKASGSRFELNLATESGVPSLPTNEPIGWIARAYDGESYSPWSWTGEQARCRFVIDPTAPDPPTITSPDFPADGSWTDLVGEYGRFTFSSTAPDVANFRYDFTGDDQGPVMVAAETDGTAQVAFMPTQPGPVLLSVEALDLAENSSSVGSYDFAVSVRPATGEWALADPPASTEAADASGTNAAVAGSGVTFGTAGPGASTAVLLDGTADGYLRAPARDLADTGEGFAASAWVRVDDLSRDQAAVSVNGAGEPGFVLGYDAAEQAWTFEIPDFDLAAFRRWRVTSDANSVEIGEWAHLVGVYDAADMSMTLYVNGAEAGTGQRGSSWHGTGMVQIGRAYQSGLYGGFWDGALAEVRVFDRVLSGDEVAVLSALTPLRLGYWQLNTAPGGVSPEYDGGAGLTLGGGASIYTQVDPEFDPTPLTGDGHLVLDGVDDYAAATGPVVDTSGSFTVTARVRLTSAQPGSDMTVLSIAGTNTSMFTVRYSAALDLWELVLTESDVSSPQTVSASNPEPPTADANGQFLAVVYNALTDQATLYVDGVASAPLSEPFADPWSATGGLQVGRSLDAGGFGQYLSGAVDEVRTYRGVADATMIQRLGLLVENPDL